jgi:DNA-binding NarL/FixJ family response regulator
LAALVLVAADGRGGHVQGRPRQRAARQRRSHAGRAPRLGKTATTDELLAGIRTIGAGDSLLSPQATRLLITRFLTTPEPGSDLPDGSILADLAAREREVMALAAEGYSNDEIAAKLFLSTHTVRTHIQGP